ncbi:MAG: NUDIX domain-containing protein [Pseudomonadota bacterium]
MQERPAARLLVLDPDNCVLLFHFVFDEGALKGRRFWATPGGALKRGESFLEAAQRELLEETGIVAPIGHEILQRTVTFETAVGDKVEADERYFIVRVADRSIDESGQEPAEARYMKAYRWWSLSELAETDEQIFPEDISSVIAMQI